MKAGMLRNVEGMSRSLKNEAFCPLFFLSIICWMWDTQCMRKLNMKIVLTGGSLIVLGIVAGCVSVQESGGQSQVVQAPKPTRRMAVMSGVDYETLGRGYSAYIKQCAQCHEYKLPDDLSRAEWHRENWNVGMEKKDGLALLQYLKAEIKTR
jgi:hypothetical protein